MPQAYPHTHDSEREPDAPSGFDAAVEAWCERRLGKPEPDPLDEMPPGPKRMEARERRLLATGVVSLDRSIEAGYGDPSSLPDHLGEAERRLDTKLDRLATRRVLRRRRVERARRPTCTRRSPRRRRSPGRRARASSVGSRGDPDGDGEPEPEAPVTPSAAPSGGCAPELGFPEPLTACPRRSEPVFGGAP